MKQVQLKRQQSNVSQMWGKVSQRVMNIVRGDPEKSGKVHDADNLPAAQTSPPKDRVEVVTLVLLVISLAIQGALAVPIGVWAYEGSIEANSRHISLFLGCSGAIMAVFGILSLFQLRRWQISIFTAFQPWVVALGVIYLATYIKDLVKLQEICEGEDTGACPTLIDDASARISYGTGIVFFTTLNSIFMNIKKDALVSDAPSLVPSRLQPGPLCHWAPGPPIAPLAQQALWSPDAPPLCRHRR